MIDAVTALPVLDQPVRRAIAEATGSAPQDWYDLSYGYDHAVFGTDSLILRVATGLAAPRLFHQLEVLRHCPPGLAPVPVDFGVSAPADGQGGSGPYWEWTKVHPPTFLVPGGQPLGTQVPMAWTIESRMPGQKLSDAWLELPASEREPYCHAYLSLLSELQESIPVTAVNAPFFAPRTESTATLLNAFEAALTRLSRHGLPEAAEAKLIQKLELIPSAPEGERQVPCHADAHPDNVLIAPDGSLRIIDFEWSRVSDADAEWDNILRWLARPEHQESHASLRVALLDVARGRGLNPEPARLWLHELTHHIRWALHHVELLPSEVSQRELERHLEAIQRSASA